MKYKNSTTENVQVFLRMRPANDKEYLNNEINLWNLGKNFIRLDTERYNYLSKQHRIHLAPYVKPCFFNRCFDSNSTNSSIYRQILRTLIEGSLSGINGTLFLYGQTGAGKTYTMMGDYSEEIMQVNLSQKRNTTPTKYSMRISNTPKSFDRSHTPIGYYKQTPLSISADKGIMNEGVLIHSLKDLFTRINKVFLYLIK